MPRRTASQSKSVDVAKEAADFVLLEQNLDVLPARDRTRAPDVRPTTLKYVFTPPPGHFGNMFQHGRPVAVPARSSAAPEANFGLNNFMSDFPAMTIATDRWHPEMVTARAVWMYLHP